MLELINQFNRFRDECAWVRHCFNIFDALYHKPDHKLVLEHSATAFFGDLNRILLEYAYLAVCRLTDPAGAANKENLTVENLNLALAQNNKSTPDIEKFSNEMMDYRRLILPARDKIIAHLGKNEHLASGSQELGAHTMDDVRSFLDAMQNYCDAVGEVLGEGPADFSCSASSGDVLDLIKILSRNAKAKLLVQETTSNAPSLEPPSL
jgi:AbiU2